MCRSEAKGQLAFGRRGGKSRVSERDLYIHVWCAVMRVNNDAALVYNADEDNGVGKFGLGNDGRSNNAFIEGIWLRSVRGAKGQRLASVVNHTRILRFILRIGF